MRRAILAVTVLMMTFAAFAVAPDEILADPALEARARALSGELRCLVCQNQSIDDSDAPLAKDLRVLLRERLLAGDSDAEIKAFLVSRYGTFVLLKPPLSWRTMILWTGPFVLLALAAGGVFAAARRACRSPGAQPLTQAEKAAVEEILRNDASNLTKS